MDFVFQCRPEVTCDSFEQSVPVNRIGYLSGSYFGPSYGFGFIQNNVDYGKYNDKAKFGTVALLNLYIDSKYEKPLELLPGFRWSLLGRLDWINLTQTVSHTPSREGSGNEKKASASITQLIAGAKLSYMLGPVELFGGAMANSGGSKKYSNSSTSSDVYESSGTKYYKVYFKKVTIKSGVAPLIGVAFKW